MQVTKPHRDNGMNRRISLSPRCILISSSELDARVNSEIQTTNSAVGLRHDSTPNDERGIG